MENFNLEQTYFDKFQMFIVPNNNWCLCVTEAHLLVCEYIYKIRMAESKPSLEYRNYFGENSMLE